MKKTHIIPVLLLIIAIGFASANPHYGVNYKIYGDKTLVEISFGQVSDFEFAFPYDAEAIEVNLDAENYELLETESGEILKIPYSHNLQVSYVVESFIEKTSDRYLFIVVNDFDMPVSVILSLPEGGILAQGKNEIVVPNADSITTDGRVINLIWNNFTEGEIVIAYEKPSDASWTYFYILIILIILMIVYIVYPRVKSRLKKPEKPKAAKKVRKVSRKVKKARLKKEVTKNLFGEEKQIIEYLMDRKGKESWTKEIVRDLGISKVRLSRRLRNLVQRGLIEKIPHGNENRIRLLKKA